MDILDFWPIPSLKPRKTQIEAFSWFEDNKDAPYLILEAPTGFGKSVAAVTLSRYLTPKSGNSFILTPQIILQHQYEDTFKDIPEVDLMSLYGKVNYPCDLKHTTCDAGMEMKPRCYGCPYQEARDRAKVAANTVMNYKLALTNFAYTETFSLKNPRKLIVLDECHNLEEQLIDVSSIQISEYRCERYKIQFVIPTSTLEAIEYIRTTYLPKIESAVARLTDEVQDIIDSKSKKYTAHEIHKIKEYNGLKSHLRELQDFICNQEDYIQCEFVLLSDKASFSFKRLFGAHAFNHILKPYGKQMLFMSATILNKNGFCKDLGINPSDAVFLSLQSEFPVNNRPVVYMPHMKMNIDWKKPEKKSDRTNLIGTIKKILDIHKNESGIIHTANFAIASWLVDELNTIDHHIHHHNPNGNNKRIDMIDSFIDDSNPSILISPSITEGLDLKEDLGRFAIIVKVPFGNLMDNWIKKRMNLSNEWYQRQALINIIQGGGRIVRTPTDKGNVYILDGSFFYLYNQTKHMIPQWWQDAFEII